MQTCPDLKDAVVAVLGASVGLGGLLLVFSGFLFAQAAALPSTTDNAIIRRYKSAAENAAYPFALSLILAAVACGYWFFPDARFAHGLLVAFVGLILATVGYGFWATRLL